MVSEASEANPQISAGLVYARQATANGDHDIGHNLITTLHKFYLLKEGL